MKKRTIAAVTSLILVSCSMRDDIGPTTSIVEDIDSTYGGIIDTSIVIDTSETGDTLNIDTLLLDTNGNIIVIDTSGSQDKGVAIISERTETIHLIGGSNILTAVGEDTVALKDIRNEIEKENMSLPLFSVSDIMIKGKASNDAIVNQFKDVQLELKVYTILPGEEPEYSLKTPSVAGASKALTLAELHAGVTLNDGIYLANGDALTSFTDKVKDESKDKIIFRVEVTFTEEVTLPEDFSLEFTIEGQSKKKL